MLSACANVSDLCFTSTSSDCRQADLSFSEENPSSPSQRQPDADCDVPCEAVEIRSKPRILEKRVSFPTDESLLVRNLEPTVPEAPLG